MRPSRSHTPGHTADAAAPWAVNEFATSNASTPLRVSEALIALSPLPTALTHGATHSPSRQRTPSHHTGRGTSTEEATGHASLADSPSPSHVGTVRRSCRDARGRGRDGSADARASVDDDDDNDDNDDNDDAQASAVVSTAAATRAAAELIQRLVEDWQPCEHADLPPRYRNVPGYCCQYCTYSVCEGCLAQVPAALLEPVARGVSATASAPDTDAVLVSSTPSSAAEALAVMACELVAGHTRFCSPTPALLPPPSRGACFRCHLCKRGVLVHEVALVHEWSCEGPMPEARVRRRHSVVYDTVMLQRYHFMKEQHRTREASFQRLQARFHGSLSAGVAAAAALKRLPGRPLRCEEGGSFIFSVENPRLAEACVWCTVNTAPRQTSPGFRGLMTVTPVLPWVCPPSLPGVPPPRYRLHVPVGAYAFDQAHALALFLRSDIFRKASSQLAMVVPSDGAGVSAASGVTLLGTPSPSPSKTRPSRAQTRRGGGRRLAGRRRSGSSRRAAPVLHVQSQGPVLGTTMVLPVSAIESLLTVHLVHHLAVQRVPPRSVGATWGTEAPSSATWRVEPFTESDERALLQDVVVSSSTTTTSAVGGLPPSPFPSSQRKRARAVLEHEESPIAEAGSSSSPGVPQTTAEDEAAAAGLAWPPGLSSEELRLAVDHLMQGRSLAVYGLGSKRFFLQHVAQSASLKDYLVVTVDGAHSTRDVGGGKVGGATSTASRQLREALRYLTTRAARPNRADEAGAGDTTWLRPGRIPEARSRSLPRDTTAGTLAANVRSHKAAVVDVVDVDVDAGPDGPASAPRALSPNVGGAPVGEGLRTPRRPGVSGDDVAARALPPPTQLRPRPARSASVSDEAEDGVGEMVRELAKALSSPVRQASVASLSQLLLSPAPSFDHGRQAQRRALSSSSTAAAPPPPRVELGLSTTPVPVEAVQSSPSVPAPMTAVAGSHDPLGGVVEAAGTRARAGETLLAALHRPSPPGLHVKPLGAAAQAALRTADTSFTFDAPHLVCDPPTSHSSAPETTTGEWKVQTGGAARARFACAADHARYLQRVRRLVGGHCTRWHSLPSATALSLVQNAGDTAASPRYDDVTLATLHEERRPRALPPPMLLVVHHVDWLDAEAEARLLQLCRLFAFPRRHVQLLVSFDRPNWPLSGLASALESLSLVMLQLRSLMLPRVQELREVHALDLLTQFESAAAGVKVSGTAGAGGPRGAGHGQHTLPSQDTLRRVLYSLPATFAELLHILLTAQEEHGENHHISLFTLGEYFEKNGLLVSHGRMKALQRELTSNRLAVYDAAEHTLYIPQHRTLAKVLEEVSARRQEGGDKQGFAETTG